MKCLIIKQFNKVYGVIRVVLHLKFENRTSFFLTKLANTCLLDKQ